MNAQDSLTSALASAVSGCCQLIEKIHELESSQTVETFSGAAAALHGMTSNKDMAILRAIPDGDGLGLGERSAWVYGFGFGVSESIIVESLLLFCGPA